MKNNIILFILLFFCCQSAYSQEKDSIANPRENALDIFIDCNYSCDFQFIKNNITFVNYMRDVTDAAVYIRVAGQSTGSGGSEIKITLEGQGDYTGQQNEITYTTEAVSTSDERRNIMVRNMKAGLMPFVAQTPLFDQMDIQYTELAENIENEVIEDKWNSWVYRASVNGWFNGQSSYQSLNTYGSLSASK